MLTWSYLMQTVRIAFLKAKKQNSRKPVEQQINKSLYKHKVLKQYIMLDSFRALVARDALFHCLFFVM